MISVPEAGDVADHAAPRGRGERVEELVREAVRVGREWRSA